MKIITIAKFYAQLGIHAKYSINCLVTEQSKIMETILSL